MFNDNIYINKDAVNLYANTNEEFIKFPIKGIIVELPGLGGGSCLGGTMDMRPYDAGHIKYYAEKGILVAYMFPGPWSWGNKGAVRMTDALIDALIDKYDLSEDIPLVISGGSMGGLGSLNFASGTRHKLSGCAAACPVVDTVFSMDVHPEFPRTLISAVASLNLPFEDALKEISPMENTDKLPFIKYYICSDGGDELIPEAQIESYIEKMKERNLDVTYRAQPGLVHGGFTSEVWDELHKFMEDCILK